MDICKASDINPDLLAKALQDTTLEDVFRDLQVLFDGTTGLPPPNRMNPKDSETTSYEKIPTERFSYLTPTRDAYVTSALFANGLPTDRLQCALTALNYNDANGKSVFDKVSTIRDENEGKGVADTDKAIKAYLDTLSSTNQLSYAIYSTIAFIQQFGSGDLNADGDSTAISRQDFQELADESGEFAQQQVDKGNIRMHTLLGIVEFFANPPENALKHDGETPIISISSGNNYALKAPEGGWKAGDQILIDGKPWNTVRAGGNGEFIIPADKVPQGEHSIEIKRSSATSPLVKLKVVSSDISTWILGGIFTLATIFGLGMYVQSLRTPKTTVPKGPATPATPIAPANSPAPQASPTAERPANDYSDVLAKALAESAGPGPMAESKAIKPTFYIGRGGDAGIPLDISNLEPVMKTLISGKHVGVEAEGGIYRVVDQGRNPDIAMVERSGVAFKMSRDAKSPTVLKLGDILDIGGSRLVFLGTPSDPTEPMSAFGQAKNVLVSQSLIIQPLVAAAGNGTNGKSHDAKPTEEDVRQKLLSGFPNSMKSADRKNPHSDYADRFNDMVKKVMNDPKLTAKTLDVIAARTTEAAFTEWGQNKKAYAMELRLEYLKVAGEAELRAKEAEKAESRAP